MKTRRVTAVLGGAGFIGRYVVQRLAAQGDVVRVGGRDTERARARMTAGVVGQVVPLYTDIGREETVARLVDGADRVVNLVGLLAERRPGDFARAHAEGAGRVARLAAAAGATRFVQISAIGADPASPSAYGKTKAEGEAAVRGAFPEATILRPSIVFGEEDQFFNRFAALAVNAPVMPVIHGATRFQPVYVGDVADAVIAAFGRDDARGRIYELGGPAIMSFRDILGWILARTDRHRPLVTVPDGVARLLTVIPFSGLTHDQLLMLGRDNVVSEGAAGIEALGIVPTPIDLVVPQYLVRFRKGGRRGSEELLGPHAD